MTPEERHELEQTLTRHHSEANFHTTAEALVRGYGPELAAYLGAIHRDPDATADVFARWTEAMWTALPRFEGRSSFRTWSYAIARAVSARYLRDPLRRRGRRLVTDELAGVADQVRERTLLHLRTEVKDAVAELRAELDPADQTLLILRIDRELPWRDVAEIMVESDDPDDRALKREAARLRKRFERVKTQLRSLAEDAGLLDA